MYIPEQRLPTDPQPPTNGEIAYQATLDETIAYNALHRYRLLSRPDITINPTIDAPHVIPHLFEAQDRLAADLETLLPYIAHEPHQPDYYGD